VAAVVLPAAGQDGWHNSWLPAIYEITATTAVLAVGLYAGTRRAYLAELRDRARRLERERDQNSALAAAVERARIAREMHDSVAHHLTVIVALSDGALAAVTASQTSRPMPSGTCPAPPGRHSPRPAACSASCGPAPGRNPAAAAWSGRPGRGLITPGAHPPDGPAHPC
jgi:Histidine kinase